MGYKVLYDNQLLFDPYTDDRITDTKLSSKLNAASYFDFTIAPTHSLYSKLAERAGEVRIYFNNLILFKGEITKIEEDFEGNYSVSCTGVLDYLTATRVRPYSTVEGEQPLKAPSSYDGYFQWLIDQHNSNCLDSRKHFSVGVNQGNMLDKNNYIYRSSEQRPTTASEIEDKILNSAGGYLFVRYQDDLNILDLYADVHDVNTQIIDYGVNMLDFTKTTTAESQYTAVVATGYTPNPPEGQPDAKMKPITLEGCTDGGTPYSSTIVKMGDRVYDVEAVARYGYNEYYVSNTDITTYDGLLYYACKTLNTLLSPALTISVKAVDLALIMGDKYKHLQLGQAVRIRSKPRKVDEYLMVNSIDLDLMNPENTTFDLGASYDTLTGQQSAYLKTLNASINASLDTVDALSIDVKNSAKLAQEAKDTATDAKDTANDAQIKVEESINKSNEAISASKDASDKAHEASNKADEANAKTELIQNTLTEISGDTAQAIANAEKAQEAADAAKKAADDAQSSADANATEVGKVKSQVEIINGEISDVKQESANIRNDLSGQITTVKNTMEADYSRKTELTETTETLRNEISESAAGVLRTVSSDYASKAELKTTTDATNKNAQDLTTLSNHVEETYSTKSEFRQLSDTVSSTVSSVETIRINAEAAQTSANNAQKAADDAQEAADTAKANAVTAQSKADEAANNLATAEENLKTLQSQANATDEQVAAAKSEVEKAKTAAATAQSKANAASSAASTAQSTADTAKANAKKAQDDVNALKNRVTSAETKITQNSEEIALKATKTEVTNVQGTADTALSTATTASNDASTALSTANTAKSTADTANSTANAVKNDLANNYSTTTEMNSSINQTAESITSTVSKEYTKITDADKKYATKTSLTQTANDLTIDFDNKIDNINKYVRFVDGNVILGEAGNPTTLKISNDHLDILNNADVVAKFAENAIELGNKSYQSAIKLCKGLGTIQGFVYGENDSDPIIEIGASSGVRLHATRTIDAGHFSMGHFGILTSSDASNSETSMVSESYLRGDNTSVMKDAAISVYTSNTGDSVCRLSASKIQINGLDSFELTKLWSGNLSKGGSVNVIQGNQYTLFAVRPGYDGIVMIGAKYGNQLHCYASVDSGSATYQYRASFTINDFTFRLDGASCNLLNGANTSYTVTEIYGIL